VIRGVRGDYAGERGGGLGKSRGSLPILGNSDPKERI
jgi:hypothetical protein